MTTVTRRVLAGAREWTVFFCGLKRRKEYRRTLQAALKFSGERHAGFSSAERASPARGSLSSRHWPGRRTGRSFRSAGKGNAPRFPNFGKTRSAWCSLLFCALPAQDRGGGTGNDAPFIRRGRRRGPWGPGAGPCPGLRGRRSRLRECRRSRRWRGRRRRSVPRAGRFCRLR